MLLLDKNYEEKGVLKEFKLILLTIISFISKKNYGSSFKDL